MSKQKKQVWLPLQSRIKIELMKEELSSILQVETRDLYVRAKIIAVGPQAGMDKIFIEHGLNTQGSQENPRLLVQGQRIHEFKPGDIIIVNKNSIISYEGADRVKHLFLKDESHAVAILGDEE